MKEVDRWLELYELHDKYTFVGHLVDDPVNDILDHIEDDEESETVEEETEQQEEETVEV